MKPHLSPAITKFLTNLAKHNNRDWFLTHKAEYQAARSDLEVIVAELIRQVGKFHELGDLQPDQCIFRLNRDVRFSKDKTPYKTHFGAVIGKGGKKFHGVAYYLHIEPGNTFVAGGSMCLGKEILGPLREQLAQDAKEFRSIISAKKFKEYFPEIWGEQVKTAPQGYPKSHPNIDLLKYKTFGVKHHVPKKIQTSDEFIPYCTKAFKLMQPFIEYLNRFANSNYP